MQENCNGQRPSLANGPEVHRLSKSHLTQHNVMHAKPAPPLEWIVVRIEVSDTGCGIRPKDMVQSKLFCKHLCLTLTYDITEQAYDSRF